ncbi:MAG: sodium:solute symporter family protein, partial [Candidatus Marinimicrobia bacterium]|nr:sodium:solute symporter family protein [Candidatus Neomarinimicrobiota bacterium]
MFHLTVVFTYLFILVGVGIHKSRKVKTQSDFAVAGRSLTPWVLVGTMLATWIGTGSILGNAGKTYETGMAAFILP